MFDKNVDRFLIRDCDSILSTREANVVKLWCEEGSDFIIIRDHPFHHQEMMAGLWGGKPIKEYLKKTFVKHPFANYYGNDQKILKKFIYPIIKKRALIFDNFHFFKDEKVIYTPYDFSDFGFMGCVDTVPEIKEANLNDLRIYLESEQLNF